MVDRVDTVCAKEVLDRTTLFGILAFLEEKLPKHCDVHSMVLSALRTANPSYKIYVSASPDNRAGTYSAVVAMRRESLLDAKRETQTVWSLASWAKSNAALCNVFEGIDAIDWREHHVLEFGSEDSLGELAKLFGARSLVGGSHEYVSNQFYVDMPTALRIQIKLPEGVYVKSLERCHAQAIYDHWQYRETTSVESIAEELSRQPSAGVFLKSDDQLVSWAMVNPPNGIGRLHTVDGHRYRGYASLAVKYLCKRMAQCGYLPYANIVEGKEESRRLFLALDFRFSRPIHDILYSPLSQSQRLRRSHGDQH